MSLNLFLNANKMVVLATDSIILTNKSNKMFINITIKSKVKKVISEH